MPPDYQERLNMEIQNLIQKYGDSFSFAGCGFLGSYHIGVAAVLKTHIPHLLTNAKFAGASAGALMAACLVLDIPIEDLVRLVAKTVRKTRKYKLYAFDPDHPINECLKQCLEQVLPADAYFRCSGRLFISCTQFGLTGRQSIIISQFNTQEDLINALLQSSFIPAFSSAHLNPGTLRIDGGFSDNLPYIDHNTIRVCPWAGHEDICPSDHNPKQGAQVLTISNTRVAITMANFTRFLTAFFTDKGEVLHQNCLAGVQDAYRFLVVNNMIRCPAHIQYSHLPLREITTHDLCPECFDLKYSEPEHMVQPQYLVAFDEFNRPVRHDWHQMLLLFNLAVTIFNAACFTFRALFDMLLQLLLGLSVVFAEFWTTVPQFVTFLRGGCLRASKWSIIIAPVTKLLHQLGRIFLLLMIKFMVLCCFAAKAVVCVPMVKKVISWTRRGVAMLANKGMNRGNCPKAKRFTMCTCLQEGCNLPHRVPLCECSEVNCSKLHLQVSYPNI